MSMISYLSSKILNSHRKCDLYLDLKGRLKGHLKEKGGKESSNHSIHISLSIIDTKVPFNLIFKNRPLKTYYEAGKIVGHFLAEKLYELITMKEVSLSDAFLRDLLFNPHLTAEEFHSFKKIILPDLQYKKTRKRFF